MADLIAGIISLVIAGGFLGVLVYKVTSVPLWIVILLGVAGMVVSCAEVVRGHQGR